MREPSKYTGFKAEHLNKTNGALSDYIISYDAIIPLASGDLFYVSFPKTIKTPKEPSCIKGDCLGSIDCTTESGRIVVTFHSPCTAPNSKVTFTIKDISNAKSMVPSKAMVS
jgi:hypothetical protein